MRLRNVARRALLAFGALSGLVFLGVASVIVWSLAAGPRYDDGSPNYERYQAYFSRYGRVTATAKGLGQHAEPLDLTELNGGDWTTACVFGGYVNPRDKMQALGARITDADQARWQAARDNGFRLAEVEESEIAIAFIDRSGTAGFIHFRSGIGPSGQHLERCVSRPQITLALFD